MSDEIEALRDQADALDRQSPVRLRLIEQAIRLADAARDEPRAFELRMELTNLVYYTGDWDKIFIHFAWMVSASERDPQRFRPTRLLWKYKWVVNNALDFPQVPFERIDAMLDDMARRYRAAGASPRPVHQHRAYFDMERGDEDAVIAHVRDWWDAPRDGWCDCYSCERNTLAHLYDELGEHAAARDEWLETIKGRPCFYVPGTCRGQLVEIFAREGDLRRAAAHNRHGLTALAGKRNVPTALARHAAYSASRGRAEEAISLLERSLPDGANAPDPSTRLGFLTRAVYVLDRLAASGLTRLPIRIPEGVDLDDADTEDDARGVSAARLRAWADREARRIAGAFDRRRGDDRSLRAHERYASEVWGAASR